MPKPLTAAPARERIMSQTLRKGWAIVSPGFWTGHMEMHSSHVHRTRSEAIGAWIDLIDFEKDKGYAALWARWYSKGYRAVRVEVVLP